MQQSSETNSSSKKIPHVTVAFFSLRIDPIFGRATSCRGANRKNRKVVSFYEKWLMNSVVWINLKY